MAKNELEQLRDKIATMTPIVGDDLWSRNRRAMIDHIMVNDPAEPFYWSTVQATMFVGEGKEAASAERELKNLGIFEKWDEPDFVNLLVQRHHLLYWQKHHRMKIKDLKTVVEYGGGYGAMAVVFDRLGFSGEYWFYDFPEMRLFQAYHAKKRVKNTKIKTGVHPNNPEVLISLKAMSESPMEDREMFMANMEPETFLFSYQHKWYEINNEWWFKDWAQRYFLNGGPSWKSDHSVHTTYVVSDRSGRLK